MYVAMAKSSRVLPLVYGNHVKHCLFIEKRSTINLRKIIKPYKVLSATGTELKIRVNLMKKLGNMEKEEGGFSQQWDTVG